MYTCETRAHSNKKRKNYRNLNIEKNANIENYYETINYLLDKGYYVFRLGLIAEKKMQIFREKFFDLPFDFPNRNRIFAILFSREM